MDSTFSSVSNFVSEHPTSIKIFVGGAVCSILAQACIKASQALVEWKKNEKDKCPIDHRTEAAVGAVLAGVGKGFVKGLVTAPIWPVHLVAVGYVLSVKDIQ